MANSRSRRSSNRRNNSGRRRPQTFGRPRWPMLVVIILLATTIVAFCARKHISRSATNPDSSRYSGLHYPDLEITQGGAKSSKVKRYEGFTVGFNSENRTPEWVGWELLASEVDGEESRSDKFWQDYELEGCASPDDYKRSGYDKGHLCPAADQKWSPAAMSDCFVMANMAPQDHALNAGAWKTLEEKERLWARRDSAIVIVAGPVYRDNDRTTIGAGVRIPSAFYKVLLAPYLDKPRAIGFIYPNMRAPGNMADYAMSVDEVERLTGLDFFSSLPDDIENEVEKYYDFKLWNKQ